MFRIAMYILGSFTMLLGVSLIALSWSQGATVGEIWRLGFLSFVGTGLCMIFLGARRGLGKKCKPGSARVDRSVVD